MSAKASEFTVGDRVQVEIGAPNNPFGSTQMASFDVEEVHDDKVFGVDPDWGDECEIIALDTDEPHFADAGKSGDVVEIRIHETDSDGVMYADSYQTVYSA